MAFMNIRKYGTLSLEDMRNEFSRAATQVSKLAYARTKDTSPEIYRLLWGDRLTAKQLEKSVLDSTVENERMRYITAYGKLKNTYGNKYTLESKESQINFAKSMFPGAPEAVALKKLRETEKYLKDPEIAKIRKKAGYSEEDSLSTSDLVRMYISMDDGLMEESGLTAAELSALERSMPSAQDFRLHLMKLIVDKKKEALKNYYMSQEDKDLPSAQKIFDANTPEELEAAWREYAMNPNNMMWKTGFLDEENDDKSFMELLEEYRRNSGGLIQ